MEKWLIQVEEVMISSLKKVTEDAVNAYNQTPRGKWVQEWPGQVTHYFVDRKFAPPSSSSQRTGFGIHNSFL